MYIGRVTRRTGLRKPHVIVTRNPLSESWSIDADKRTTEDVAVWHTCQVDASPQDGQRPMTNPTTPKPTNHVATKSVFCYKPKPYRIILYSNSMVGDGLQIPQNPHIALSIFYIVIIFYFIFFWGLILIFIYQLFFLGILGIKFKFDNNWLKVMR